MIVAFLAIKYCQQGSDDYPEGESQIDDVQWQYPTRSNKRGNKAPRFNSFVQGRTITSSSRGNGRTEKNTTRYIFPQDEERKQIDLQKISIVVITTDLYHLKMNVSEK